MSKFNFRKGDIIRHLYNTSINHAFMREPENVAACDDYVVISETQMSDNGGNIKDIKFAKNDEIEIIKSKHFSCKIHMFIDYGDYGEKYDKELNIDIFENEIKKHANKFKEYILKADFVKNHLEKYNLKVDSLYIEKNYGSNSYDIYDNDDDLVCELMYYEI